MSEPAPPYPAALYAALHRGNTGDLELYRRACAGASSVLELGCGYGRVLAALADVVPERWGLDAHPGLIDLARDRSDATVVHGSMQSFALGRAFDRVLIPYNGLYCLLTDEDVTACLANARRHLAPGGRLVLDVYAYDGPLDEDERAAAAEESLIVQIEESGVGYRVYESVVFDAATERAEVTYRYEPTQEGAASISGTIAQRGLAAPRLRALLQGAGFAVERWMGGFDEEPLDEDAEQWVVVARASDSGRE